VEKELFREFRRAYHDYAAHPPKPESVLEWLSLMQHHGAPTRLLDFTYSIYVAAYFAVETATASAAVWAVRIDWALEESARSLRAAGKRPSDLRKLKVRFVEGTEQIITPLLFQKRFAKLACPVNAFRLNERLRIQKGLFLAPGSINCTFMENLTAMNGHDDPKNVFRIVIPADQIRNMRAALFDMNITRRALFPGLDGYAQSLGIWHPVFDPQSRLHKAVMKSV
jgi:FRG domain